MTFPIDLRPLPSVAVLVSLLSFGMGYLYLMAGPATSAPIPLDAWVPARVETATFALG